MKIISALFLCFFYGIAAFGQHSIIDRDYLLLDLRISESYKTADITDTAEANQNGYPEPKSVLSKSLMVPGWGQIVNRQPWKVPIIYGVFVGIGYYTYTVHQDYTDYRAAFYNAERGEDTDFKFGPTPDELVGMNTNQLREVRNSLRNRRDLMFVVMFLAHGLNAVDAYVFAHMRSFDVSDDLSARAVIGPDMLADSSPGITLSIQFKRK
jgi:hypothetical protein